MGGVPDTSTSAASVGSCKTSPGVIRGRGVSWLDTARCDSQGERVRRGFAGRSVPSWCRARRRAVVPYARHWVQRPPARGSIGPVGLLDLMERLGDEECGGQLL